MVNRIKRKTVWIFSLFVFGLLSFITSHLRSNVSKEGSLLAPQAKADVPSCTNQFWCEDIYMPDQCVAWFGCFPAGTLIDTPDGEKEIQTFKPGDSILGFSIETGKLEPSVVKNVFTHTVGDPGFIPSPLIIINHEQGKLSVTDNHWIFHRNGRDGEYANFDRAGMLKVGDALVLENGEETKILGIESGPDYQTVYDLEVEKVHTYLAGGVRVHNSCSCGSGSDCCGGGCGDGGNPSSCGSWICK